MTRPHYDDIRTIPLPTDRELIPHLQVMLEMALRRQVWIMVLDEHSCPLPILMPLDVEAEPYSDDVSAFADTLRCLTMDFTDSTLVLTLERPGPAAIMGCDKRWLRSIRESCVESGASFRGPYLLLGDTVRQVAPDDYVSTPWVCLDDDECDDYGSF